MSKETENLAQSAVERARESIPEIDSVLSRLEGRALQTEAKAEKEGIMSVIERIKQLRAGREGVSERNIEGLRASLSETDRRTIARTLGDASIAERLDVKDAVAKVGEFAKPAKQAVTEVAGNLSDAREKLAKGDTVAAKAAAVDAVKQARSAGAAGIEKAQEVGMVVALENGVSALIEWIKSIFRGIVAFFSADLANSLFGKAKDAKDAAWAAVQGAKDAITNPETAEAVKKAAEEAIEVRKLDFMKKLSREYGIDFNDQKKLDKFNAIWKKYGTEMVGSYEKAAKNFKEGGKDNLIDYPLLAGATGFSFMMELFREDILPISAITVRMAEGAERAVEIGFSLGKELISFNGVEQVLGRLSIEEFGKEFGNMAPNEKLAFAHMLEHKFAPAAYLAGIAGGLLTSGVLMYPTWKEWVLVGTGIADMKLVLGKYEQASKSVMEVYSILGLKNQTPQADTLRKMLTESITKMFAVEAARSAKTGTEFLAHFDKLVAIDPKLVNPEAIADFKKTFSNPSVAITEEARAHIQQVIRTNHVQASSAWAGELRAWDRIKGSTDRAFHGYFADSKVYLDDVFRQKELVNAALAESVKEKNSIFALMKNFGMIRKFSAYPTIGQKAAFALNAKDADSFAKAVSGVAKESPELVRAFFSNIAIVISGVGIAESIKADPTQSPSWLVLKGLAGLAPLSGALMVAYEGGEIENGMPTKPMNIAIGWSMLALDALEAGKLLATNAPFERWVRFAGRPIFMAGEFAVGTYRTVFEAVKTTAGVMKNGKSSAAAAAELRMLGARFAETGVYGVALAFLIGIGYDAYKSHKDSELFAELQKDGLVGSNGAPVPSVISERISLLPKDKQDMLVEMVAGASLWGGDRKFDIRSGDKGYSLVIEDVIAQGEASTVAKTFEQFGLQVKVAYAEAAIYKLAEQYKTSGYSKTLFGNRLAELGIKNPEKYFI